MTDLRKKAEEVVRNSYVTNFDEHEGDTEFISDGRLVLLITEALTQTRLEAIEECAKVAEAYDSYDSECFAYGHDDRWCSYCEDKNDGADAVSRIIRKLGEGKL